jgi:4a-hydroxytetrahydrobiopterin dehydratase
MVSAHARPVTQSQTSGVAIADRASENGCTAVSWCEEAEMPVLDRADVDERLKGAAGWQRHDDEIRKEFRFGSFRQAMAFVDRVAEVAEAADHHPDITINYNRVTMALSTHSEHGITNKDFDLASKIDGVL